MTLEEERQLLVLYAIISLGGSTEKRGVLDWIEERGVRTKQDRDYELHSNREPRWENDVAQTVRHLRPSAIERTRGRWIITERGRVKFAKLADRVGVTNATRYISPEYVEAIVQAAGALTDEYPWADAPTLAEGSPVLVWSIRYERDPEVRRRALEAHGETCQACGFNFFERYGELGRGFVEVHHLKPISSVGALHVVDPVADMAVLCSNCHRMVHRSGKVPMTVEVLGELIASR